MQQTVMSFCGKIISEYRIIESKIVDMILTISRIIEIIFPPIALLFL